MKGSGWSPWGNQKKTYEKDRKNIKNNPNRNKKGEDVLKKTNLFQ